jgi:hypothetical protein
MQCSNCNEEIVSGANFCHRCGKQLAGEPAAAASNAPSLFQPPPVDSANKGAETVLWTGGYSPKAMLGAWCLCTLLSVTAVVLGGIWHETINAVGWWLLAAVFFLPWFYYIALLGYRKFSIHYTLTTLQLIHETGLLKRVNNRMDTIAMDDITFTQTLTQRIAGVGDIRILSGDKSDPTFILHGIERVAEVAEQFNNARRDERRRRGVHVEQI